MRAQTKPDEKAAAAATAATIGQWASPVYFCQKEPCVVGGNAILLHTGSVLFYYYPVLPGNWNSQAVLLDPLTGVVTDVALTVPRDIFCSGVTVLANGQVAITGGVLDSGNHGTTYTTIFDPLTSAWSIGQDMHYARWYPSSVELSNGTVLEMSGVDSTGKYVQTALEYYNYTTGAWTDLPASANMPSSVLYAYPRLSLLPGGSVFLSSPAPTTYLFNPDTYVWSPVGTVNYGFRFFAPHVLLPGLERVMVAGGSPTYVDGGSSATNTAEIIDLSASTPVWTYTGSMTYPRYNENLVLLADGTVLAVGGGGGGGQFTNPVYTPELYDPTTGQWSVMAPQAIQRTYHSTALLSPDGRVVSSGSNNGAPTQITYEIYSPPYLFKGDRPVIESAPTSITYGATFSITAKQAGGITRVALIRPGATTHADDFDQRYVDLAFTVDKGVIQATAPANGNVAPPGYYMLVIVSSNGVPSVMPFVQLQTSTTQKRPAPVAQRPRKSRR